MCPWFAHTGPHFSSWILQIDLQYVQMLHEHLKKKFRIYENPFNSEKCLYSTRALECM